MTQQLTETVSWRALQTHYETIKDISLRRLFAEDSGRGERLRRKRRSLPGLLEEPNYR
jgi:glucose-6-phosphate isomerase